MTGDGKCNAECGQGMISKRTGRYVHHQAHGVHPSKGARGAGATAEKHGMPEALLEEVLDSAGVDDTWTVMDLCAGHQSMKKSALKRKSRYVAVDRMGLRLTRAEKIVRAALCAVREVDGIVEMIAVNVEGQWQIPGGDRHEHDKSAYEAAVRMWEEQTGLDRCLVQDALRDVPIRLSVAGKGSRYFVCKTEGLWDIAVSKHVAWVSVEGTTEEHWSSADWDVFSKMRSHLSRNR